MEYVYIVQMMREDGAIMGAPIAVFSQLSDAEHYVLVKYSYECVGHSSAGYSIYKSEYNHRVAISRELVR